MKFKSKDIQQNVFQRVVIKRKLEDGTPLTLDEQYLMCDQLEMESCAKRPECADVYYTRIYHGRGPKTPALLRISEADRNNFERFVKEWETEINKIQPVGSLMHASSRETKEEIKSLKKEFADLTNPKVKKVYENKYFELLAWSKFRHLTIKRVFDLDIKAKIYPLFLNGQEIRFDCYSYVHILTRHFAHAMKQYSSSKDHFYDVFKHTDLHSRFEQLFKALDKSGLYVKDSIEEVNFRFEGIIYRIYIKKETFFSPGITGPQTYMRLSTFFPISEKEMLDKLADEYQEKSVEEGLSIFVKK